MNYIKKSFSVLIVLVILGNITVFAGKAEDNITKCKGKEGFQLYKCEKKEVCKGEDLWENTKKIVSIEKIYEEKTSYKSAKNIYRFNQNVIYKCGTLNSQKKAFSELKILLKSSDKTGIVQTKVIPKIEEKIKKIDKLINKNKCRTIIQKGETKEVVKKIVLDQSTLEYCHYKYFLEYLDHLEDNGLEKNYPKGKTEISAQKAAEIITDNKNNIQDEIDHTDKMYPIAFETYTQYDSFIKIHIILELIKEDYRTLRDKLYQVLHPINQVVYKIINAQSDNPN